MGALPSRSYEDTPGLPVGLFYRRFWYGETMQHVLDTPPKNYPQPSDLLMLIPIAFIISLIRLAYERLMTPVAVARCGLTREPLMSKQLQPPIPPAAMQYMASFRSQQLAFAAKLKKMKKKAASSNDNNTAAVSASGAPSKQRLYEDLQRAAGGSSLGVVRGWYELYSADMKRNAALQKFLEASWRFSFYLFIFIYGLAVMSMTNISLFDLSNMFADWHQYELSEGIRWYYYLSSGHYVHLLVFQFRDVKRKDFTEMFIHHLVTLFLLVQSFLLNFTKFGACILILHDASDIFLELAKLFNYCNKQMLTDATFVVFAIVFIVTRVFYFPTYLMHSSLFDAGKRFSYPTAWMIINGLLAALLVLNVIWASIIAKMAYTFVVVGKVENDARSEDEAEIIASAENSGDTKKAK